MNMTEKLITTNINMVNMTENISFGQIHTLMFFVVIFILFSIFSQIHPYFGHTHTVLFVIEKFRSSSNINVCRCEIFSVKFLLILGHLDSVK